jgi:hypothetical protein
VAVVSRLDDYTPGAGGALTGAESALSSLPECPCWWLGLSGPSSRALDGETHCSKPARREPGHSCELRCSSGHVYRGTPQELADADGAERAAARRRS